MFKSTPFRSKPLFALLLSTAIHIAIAGQIRLCAKVALNDDSGVVIKNADVTCWDNDWGSNDDQMTEGITGSDGCVTLNYTTKRWSYWSCKGWDCWRNPWSNPDIFCQVSGVCLAPELTEVKNNIDQDTLLDFGNVYVSASADSSYCADNEGWNGCGPFIVPDFLTDIASDVFNFRDACNTHDVCYSDCATKRSDCDNSFKDGMSQECENGLCETLADIFYGGVHRLGESFCIEGREERCSTQEQINGCRI